MNNTTVNSQRPKMSPLTLNEKTLIMNCYNEHLTKNGKVTSKAVELTSQTLGIEKSTIFKIIEEDKTGRIKGPNKPTGRPKLNDSIKCGLRRKAHSFYFQHEIPTLGKILTTVNEDPDFPDISRTRLRKTFKKIGFKWKKHEKKSILIEKSATIIWRRQYLDKIKTAREENKNIFYAGDTWFNAGCEDQNKKNQHPAALEGPTQPSDEGRKLIVTNVGTAEGFLDGGLFTIETENHEAMTSDIYEEWFSQILDIIPAGSIIVVNNAAHHTRLVEKLPNINWRKQEMKDWLTSKGIEYREDAFIPELFYLCKHNKNKYKKFVLEDMAEKRGMTLLRFPPFHSDLNPADMIWTQIKGEIARKNTTFQMKDLKDSLESAIASVTEEDWKKCLNRVIEEEVKMWDVDDIQEELCERICEIVDLSSSSDSDFDP